MRNLCIVTAVVLLSLGCQRDTPNGAGNTIASEGQQAAATRAPQAPDNMNSPPKPTPADESMQLKADFEGTAGATEKKYEIRDATVLTDVRIGRHDGFDRIVFEFQGAEMPGYQIEYIDKPVRACGSGNVVQLAGDAWLQLRFEPAMAHTLEGKPTVAFRELAPKLRNVLELKSTCDFEAQVEWVAGVRSPNKYRVIELTTPTRLVVDIKHK